MLRLTQQAHRYRTAWRELLHPLPIVARHDQWLKRDTVEMNESLLREPYYTIKSYSQPSYAPRGDEEARRQTSPQDAQYATASQLRAPRHAVSAARLAQLREQLQFPGVVGPLPGLSVADAGRVAVEDEYGSRLRPRHPESWDTVPPHQPSRSAI